MTRSIETTTRWSKAQAYEVAWWQERIDEINLDYLKEYAKRVAENLHGILDIRNDTKILEIGSGSAGILTFLKSDYRCALEPLESFFADIEKFSRFRDKQVKYFEGKAEKLPFKNGEFDLIIIDNVLDHCEDISKVFSEMRRVLAANGIIYMRLNVYHAWGKIVRQLSEFFQFDKGHPHTFTNVDLKRIFDQNDFSIIREIRKGVLSIWIKQLTAFKVKDFLKAVSFSTPDTIVHVISKSTATLEKQNNRSQQRSSNK